MAVPLPGPLPPPSGSSISTSKFEVPLLINRIFQLLTDIIGVLQSVAISQAERLQLLTRWQKAYTDLLDQVPVFTQNSADFGGTDTDDSVLRDDINRLNAAFSEQIRSSRSQHGDDAKALQSNLNQTNDAVTQQANLATALLQQLSTILSTLFR